jgi:hypothetical protein
MPNRATRNEVGKKRYDFATNCDQMSNFLAAKFPMPGQLSRGRLSGICEGFRPRSRSDASTEMIDECVSVPRCSSLTKCGARPQTISSRLVFGHIIAAHTLGSAAGSRRCRKAANPLIECRIRPDMSGSLSCDF